MKNNTKISMELALAIGWPLADVIAGTVVVFDGYWRKFDYRDPAVIWPIAERYKCFPQANLFDSGWHAITQNDWDEGLDQSAADTAEKAVALAVIRHHEWRQA